MIFSIKNKIRIASWNLCLGLANKKDYVSQMILSNKMDICCMQETEISSDYDHDALSFGGYSLLLELNDVKSRTAIYVKNEIKHVRRLDLEQRNCGLVIVEINMKSSYRLINVYRSFNPHGNINNQIEYDLLNKSLVSYKIACKRLFLK